MNHIYISSVLPSHLVILATIPSHPTLFLRISTLSAAGDFDPPIVAVPAPREDTLHPRSTPAAINPFSRPFAPFRPRRRAGSLRHLPRPQPTYHQLQVHYCRVIYPREGRATARNPVPLPFRGIGRIPNLRLCHCTALALTCHQIVGVKKNPS